MTNCNCTQTSNTEEWWFHTPIGHVAIFVQAVEFALNQQLI